MKGKPTRRHAAVLGLLGAFLITGILYALGGTADNVAGQNNFTNKTANFVDGRGLADPIAVAVDPVGGQVYVADYYNNRVLGWKSSTEFAGNQPADVVIGQPDFYSSYCNQNSGGTTTSPGVPAANTLCGPQGIAVDGGENVYVADTANNRILAYGNPFALAPAQTSDFNATAVFGQGSNGSGAAFTLNACGLSAIALCSPKGVATDSNGNLFVLDAVNNRVLEYFNPSGPVSANGTGDVTADFVLGQPNFTSNAPITIYTSEYGTDGGIWTQAGLAVDKSGNVYVANPGYLNVYEYNGPFNAGMNLTFNQAPNLVFNGFSGAGTLNGITVDASNNLYVAAQYSIYRYPQSSNPPTNVTPDLTISSNLNIPESIPLTYPGVFGLATDAENNLYVADLGGGRVLEYYTPGNGPLAPPGAAGDAVPDQVLGQIDFSHAIANFIDGRGLNSPGSVALDRSTGAGPNHIYVADAGNNRVLGWLSLSEFINNQPADLVVGQSDFYSVGCNQASELEGNAPPTAQSLCFPAGVAVDAKGNLYVSDLDNNRVLEFPDPFATFQSTGRNSAFVATTVFGQDGIFTTNSTPSDAPTAASLSLPSGLAFDPAGNLYIGDTFNSRVLEFSPDATGSFGPAPMPVGVFGQGGGLYNPNLR